MSDKLTRSVDNEFNNETAIKEVQYLLKNGVSELTPDIINRLRSKFSDDHVVDAIMESFADRKTKIGKVAAIFIDAFQRKYKNEFFSMSMSKFMKRALKYKSKYDFSNEELEEAKRIFEARIYNSGGVSNFVYPNTNLSRVLGYPITESTDTIKTSNTDDYAYLQEIIKLFQLYKSLHSYVVIQTMTYTDMQIEGLAGFFNRDRHNVNVHVHPLLAALFVPKISQLEERMLYANIAGIINTKYNRQRILTKPDFELFYSMVIDPADTVCDVTSPMKDLKNRVEVQIQLWNNVYNLRSGKYFEASSLEFMAYIDKCKISNIDNPNLIYLSDEGVILRRLFSIFSYRPILVQTMPILGYITVNPLNMPVTINTVTSIPFITYRLPRVNMEGKVYKLDDAIKQINYYMENGSFVPKMTNMLNVSGPIIFYVPRRFTALPLYITSPLTNYFTLDKYNNSNAHYQRINELNMDFDDKLEVKTYGDPNTAKPYYLRSFLMYEIMPNTSIVLGHSTVLYNYTRDTDQKIISGPNDAYIYDPRNAHKQEANGYAFRKNNTTVELTVLGQARGTVFIYAPN